MKTKVADLAWVATALLHREHPERLDFRRKEIKERAIKEFGQNLQPGIGQHITWHSVASNPATPARYRMLTQTSRGRRRLFRMGDEIHPDRTGKMFPERDELPAKYHDLIDWYTNEYNKEQSRKSGALRDTRPEAFLAFVGLIPAYDLKRMEEIIEMDCERTEYTEQKPKGRYARRA